MKGLHHITVETERLKYEFDIRRNITVIQGDSATGKTTLIGLLQDYARRGESGGVRIQSNVPCVVYSGDQSHWKMLLSDVRNSVVFFDENSEFIASEAFASFIQETDNYYVFITRRNLWALPYSIHEIYGIRTSGKYHFPDQVYHEFYPLYPAREPDQFDNSVVLLLEDSKSGFQFFQKAAGGLTCISAEGNSNLSRTLSSLDLSKKTVIIADGAAFGAFIRNLLLEMEIRGNAGLFLPESFEWIILKSGVIRRADVSHILEHPEDYIESDRFFSWERYFTHLLEELTKDDDVLRYQKSRLSDFYTTPQSITKILSVLPEQIQQLLGSIGQE
jgi:hypothetical protein